MWSGLLTVVMPNDSCDFRLEIFLVLTIVIHVVLHRNLPTKYRSVLTDHNIVVIMITIIMIKQCIPDLTNNINMLFAK